MEEDQPWSQEEAERFFSAFQAFGNNWQKVAAAIETKTPEASEALYRKFRSFLSLPKPLLNGTAFLAVVKDSLKLDESEADTVSDALRENATPSYDGADSENEMEGNELADGKPLRRSRRVPLKKHRSQSLDGPTWTVRRPRAPREPPGRSRRGERSSAQDIGDAEGIDALLRLADVAQNASMETYPGELEAPVSPVKKRAKRAPSRHEDESFALSPDGNRGKRGGRSGRGRRPREAGSPRTPKAARRHAPVKTKPEGEDSALQDDAQEEQERPIRRRRPRQDTSDAVKLSSRAKKGRESDEDFVLQAPPKRTKRPARADPEDTSESDGLANLEAEQEDLEDFAGASDEEEWEKSQQDPQSHRRRRKMGAEKPPPMMARSKAVFARRNVLSIHSPPPAFLIGLPPPPAQPSGVETEGQLNMGETEARLRNCLEPRVRRWCACEFFCSAIDRPWLMRNELTDYLGHVGIPRTAKLSRPELSIIRASLGRPRRLSLNYLRQERIKLEAWREEVRAQYAGAGAGADLSDEYPQQLQVGQKVVARHPITRQLHDGDVLTVTSNSYRVQFDRRELGVELVKDIDVMPVEPTACLPRSMLEASPQVVLNGRCANKANGHAMVVPAAMVAPERMVVNPSMSPPTQLSQAARQSSTAIRSLADMRAALDTKEMLMSRLAKMNEEIEAGLHTEKGNTRPVAFQKAYAQTLMDLQLMNKTLEASPYSKQLGVSESPAVMLAPPPGPPRPEPVLIPTQAGPEAGSESTSQPTEASPGSADWRETWKRSKQLVSNSGKGGSPPDHINRGDRESTPGTERVALELDSTSPNAESSTPHSQGVEASDSEAGSEGEGPPGNTLIRGCVSLMLVLIQTAKGALKSAEMNDGISQSLKILETRTPDSKPFLDSINANVTVLTSKLNLQTDVPA